MGIDPIGPNPTGLCADCRHHRVVPTFRGASFHLCRLHADDGSFAKYPPLPVLVCEGFMEAGEDSGTIEEDADA